MWSATRPKGISMSESFFEGWYFKHQKAGQTVAFIPGRSAKGAFIQVITDAGSHQVEYPLTYYSRGDIAMVGGSVFARNGLALDIRTPNLTVTGDIRYGTLTPLRRDIMGPFRFLPMECRHTVLSMRHALSGFVCVNGAHINLDGGVGYTEGDSGRSFPKSYAWVQCNDFAEDCAIMLSMARIPLAGYTFWGCIGAVHLRGREYRLATYRGAKIIRRSKGHLEIEQGRHRLAVDMAPQDGHILRAPHEGVMERIIRESPAARAGFRFSDGDHVLFEEESGGASCEYVM